MCNRYTYKAHLNPNILNKNFF